MQINHDTKQAEIAEKQAAYQQQKSEFLQEYDRLQGLDDEIIRQRKTIAAIDSELSDLQPQINAASTANAFTELKQQQRQLKEQKADCLQYVEECEMKRQQLLYFLSNKKRLVTNCHSELMENYGYSLISQTLEKSLSHFVDGVLAICESRDFIAQIQTQANTIAQEIDPQQIIIKSIVERLEKALSLAEGNSPDPFITDNRLPLGEFDKIPFISPMKARQFEQEQRRTE